MKGVRSIANNGSRRWVIGIEVVVEDGGGDAGANYLGQRWPRKLVCLKGSRRQTYVMWQTRTGHSYPTFFLAKSRSKKEINGKERLELRKDYLNQQ